ncbi:hypothetical protein HMPREF1231_0009, partial [Streptococcus pyogenes GA06023]
SPSAPIVRRFSARRSGHSGLGERKSPAKESRGLLRRLLVHVPATHRAARADAGPKRGPDRRTGPGAPRTGRDGRTVEDHAAAGGAGGATHHRCGMRGVPQGRKRRPAIARQAPPGRGADGGGAIRAAAPDGSVAEGRGHPRHVRRSGRVPRRGVSNHLGPRAQAVPRTHRQ